MTPILSSSGAAVATRRVLREQFATQIAVERTRLLYQGSLLPTLFMLLNGLVCSWLLWSPQRALLISIWLGWLTALVGLRVMQVAAFNAATPLRQAQPIWRVMFLLGAAVSGLTLASAAIALVPTDNFVQQAWVFGLIGAATLSASVAYAVSMPAFLTFTLSCLLPSIAFLFLQGDEQQRGWAWLGLILLMALVVVAVQINRLIRRGLLRRFQNQALIEDLQQAQAQGEQLNQALAREVEERMRYLTHYDELTGLANRSLFRERLREANQRVRQGGRGLALLHIDLDRFKLLNDSLGHEVADQLLRQVARRLSSALPEADTIARLSGDEFAVLLDPYGNLSSLARVTSRMLAKLRTPLLVDGQELVISASVGISLLPDSAREISVLISQANIAMQHAKHVGGNNFQFYTDSLQASTLERFQLENQLRKAIDEKQLQVFYQPKLCLATGRLNAVEALVRWKHPTLGMVPPGEFIGLAEETGLIGPSASLCCAKPVGRRGNGSVRGWSRFGYRLTCRSINCARGNWSVWSARCWKKPGWSRSILSWS